MKLCRVTQLHIASEIVSHRDMKMCRMILFLRETAKLFRTFILFVDFSQESYKKIKLDVLIKIKRTPEIVMSWDKVELWVMILRVISHLYTQQSPTHNRLSKNYFLF